MPYCDIDQDVSLYYITNTPNGDATDMDPLKPTIILLPAVFGSVTMWLREHFKDPRLSQRYNLIAFDLRNMGLTKAPFECRRDAWVDGADLAVAHEILRLPPCHVFSVATTSGAAALRFAAVFPEKCLSLCLCSAPPQPGNDPEGVEEGFLETVYGWSFPKDMADLERACMAFSWYGFNGQISAELEDEIVAWWQMNLPPTKRTTFLAQGWSALNKSRLSDEELHAIEQPTMIIQGDRASVSPPEGVQGLCEKLPNGRIFVVKGGPEQLTIIPQYASIVNRVYVQFLERLPRLTTSTPHSSSETPNPRRVLKDGLERLARLENDQSIAKRDPSATISFSLLPEDLIDQITKHYVKFAKGESEAFHALDEHGQPLRKFSDRNIDEWMPDAFQRQSMIPIDATVTVSETVTTTTVEL